MVLYQLRQSHEGCEGYLENEGFEGSVGMWGLEVIIRSGKGSDESGGSCSGECVCDGSTWGSSLVIKREENVSEYTYGWE